MSRSNLFEVIVGTFVLMVSIGFCIYAYSYSDLHHYGDGYYLDISFGNIDGITRGSDVRISGVKVGSVVLQTLDTKTFRPKVTILIDRNVQLPRDSSAKITSYGIFGKNYIALMPGNSRTYLKDGEKILYAQGSIDIISLISQTFFNGSRGGAQKSLS